MFLCIYASGYPSLEFVFDNYKLNASITHTGLLAGYTGFAKSSSNPIRYYVTNFYQKQILHSEKKKRFFGRKKRNS
jgi:hypothetical protein